MATHIRKIDYDRPGGVLIKSISSTGMEVFMYRNEPGVYYTAHGTEVNKALAEMAGFDVARHTALREHKKRVALASETIAKELDVLNGVGARVVKEELGGFRLVDIGKGRFLVEDDHGPLNQGTVLTYQMAKTVFDACVGDLRKSTVAVDDSRGRKRAATGDAPAAA